MTITQAPFGTHDDTPVVRYTLTNANGLTARLIDFGARLTELHAPGRDGTLADIVLGFDDLAAYVGTDTYFGATCGRYGNRIAKGRFPLGGGTVAVTCNEAPNHLHGGARGFDKRVWNAAVDDAANSVTFTLVSPDGEEGFPGTLVATATYRLTDDDRLLVTLTATTDRLTVLNLVNHAYWNVAGHDSGTVLDQHLTVEGDFYTPVDAALLPTGEIRAVAGTPFDFRAAKPIGRDIEDVGQAGYDHNWVLRGAGPDLHAVATLYDPASGRGFTLHANEPGVQVYTGGSLGPAVVGKGGTPYRPFAGLTFETQKFPDSPNRAHFPSARFSPGAAYDHRMDFHFFAT